MSAAITTEQVWHEVERNLFAVLGTVTPKGEARTVGIVYVVRNREFYISADRSSWKVRHIEKNPSVSLTVAIAKRVPFMPWVRIPAATVTLQGKAYLHSAAEVSSEIQSALLHGLETDNGLLSNLCIIRVQPRGNFLTYGVGVSLTTMRKPAEARGRVAVASSRDRLNSTQAR